MRSEARSAAGSTPPPVAPDARIAFGAIGASRVAVLALPRGLPAHLADRLTEAERAVADSLLDGASYAEIAAARGTSERTIANQARAVLRKLDVASRFELVLLAAKHA